MLDKIYGATTGSYPTSEFCQDIWTTFLPVRTVTDKPELENLRPSADVEVAIANLARLGLVTTAMTWAGTKIFSCVRRTVLGQVFMEACSRTKPGPEQCASAAD